MRFAYHNAAAWEPGNGTDLVAMLTLVALHDRLGVKPLFLEARLPLLVLVLHRQLLHAVNETEMHILQPTTASYQYHIRREAVRRD